jgi:hypothetical protein
LLAHADKVAAAIFKRHDLGEYTYNLTLCIKHPDADLTDVPVRLGLPARRLWKKGDPRTAPNGRVQGGIYKNSLCAIQLGQRHERSLPAGLKFALGTLLPCKEYLAELVANGAELQFFIGWFSDANSGDTLDWEILRDMAALKISLDLDFYGPDPVENSELQEQAPS